MATFYSHRWNKFPNVRRLEPDYTPTLLLQIESSGNDDTNTDRRQRIVIRGTQFLSADSPRSYRVSRLVHNNGWQYHSSNTYDVYGSTMNAQNMLAYLESFNNNDILILNTRDEPNQNREIFRNELVESFKAKLQFSNVWGFRSSYILVASKNRGVIYESIRPRYHTDGHFVTLILE